MMAWSRLLKSWATPLVSRPIASIFCAWRSFSSIAVFSVRSRVTLANPISVPPSSRTASITALAQKRVPFLRTRQPSISTRPVSAAMRSAVSGTPRRRSSSV